MSFTTFTFDTPIEVIDGETITFEFPVETVEINGTINNYVTTGLIWDSTVTNSNTITSFKTWVGSWTTYDNVSLFTTDVEAPPKPREPVPVPETFPEPTTKIRPSEAIRLGRLTKPRFVKNHYIDGEGACTWAAMAIGYGYSGNRVYCDFQVRMHFQREYGYDAGNQIYKITSQIPGWIDSGRMTEAQVIEYLESIGL